jgi:hypothetical protein
MIRNQKLEEARCANVFDEVLEALGMDWLTVHHKFSTKTDGDDARVAAETTTDWEYLQAGVEWRLPITLLLTDLELKRVAVHEAVHMLVASMEMQIPDEPLANKICELAVEHVTRAILEVLPE